MSCVALLNFFCLIFHCNCQLCINYKTLSTTLKYCFIVYIIQIVNIVLSIANMFTLVGYLRIKQRKILKKKT